VSSASPNGQIGVVGAGLMGAGIAQVAASAGHDVVLHDVSADALARACESMEWSLSRLVAKGRVDAGTAEAALGRVITTTDLDAVASAGLVVEAVPELLELKEEVFGRLDGLCAADAVLATNTSAIPITRIAAATSRPESVVGTHFFSPVPLMALCELVRGEHTSDATLARARAFAESCGKTCIVVERDVPGFVATRLIVALTLEAARLVEAGVVSAEDADAACRLGFGHPMGPLETADLTGVDVLRHAATNIADGDAAAGADGERFRPPPLVERLVADGRLGRKTGHGFHDHEEGTR
jgi:3-hydroxybutyryl-CoA dehydrogenase